MQQHRNGIADTRCGFQGSMPPQEETPATDQAEETAGRSGKMTSVLLKVGEVLKSNWDSHNH
jgi:hypothetical protein